MDPITRSANGLPRRARRDKHFSYVHVLDSCAELCPIDPVPIPEQVSRRFVPRECLDDLLCRPPGARILGDVEMHDPPSMMEQDDQDEEHLETDRGHDEEVDGDKVFDMALQERPPRRRRRLAHTGHVPLNG